MYVEDMDSAQLRAHMKMLQALPEWYHPLDDRLFKEILDLDKKIAKLEKRISDYGWEQEAQRQRYMEQDRNQYEWK